MDRYQRQMMLPEIGEAGQQRLARARVLVVGAGGLAATLLPQLAGAGVGYLRVCDDDSVEVHNLHRQTLFTPDDVGRPKAVAARRALNALNPACRVDTLTCRLSGSSLSGALHNIDLVVDAADNFAITWLLSDACHERGLPLISASVLGRQGYAGGFCGGAPSYRALFPQLPSSSASCSTAGVMGPAVATLGAIQAQMTLSTLLGLSPSPLGCVVNCDFVSWRFTGFRFDDAPEPDGSALSFIDVQMLTAQDCIVELRDRQEAPVSVADGVHRILPQDLAAWQPPRAGRIVLVCASGIRAGRAAQQLKARGYGDLALIAADYIPAR